jgi:hypothetical protein
MGDLLIFPRRSERDVLKLGQEEMADIKSHPVVQAALRNAQTPTPAISKARMEYLEAFARLKAEEGIPGAVEYAQTMLGQFIKAGICGNE